MAFSTGPKKAISEINVTPLVDVMLVLLVIFMVTAPMLQQGIDLELPEVAAQAVEQRDKKIELVIRADGSVAVDGATLPADRLDRALAAIVETRKSEPIYVEADRRVPYGTVARVLGVVRSAGATKLHLVTEEPSAR